MKKLIALMLVLSLAASLSACGTDQAETPSPSDTLSPAPEISNTPEPSPPAPETPGTPTPSAPAPEGQEMELIVRLSEGDVRKLEPYDEPFMVLLEEGILDSETYYSFSDQGRTWTWSKELFDPEDLSTMRFESNMVFEGAEDLAEQFLEEAKNPGLGVRALHERGITGEGVNVAIIDQNILLDHPEYAGRVAAYYDSGCDQQEGTGSMHGSAVLSLLAGETVGVAPGAKVWFAAAPSWELDASYYADCLNWIIEQNRELPEGEKIRVVSISAAPNITAGFANGYKWSQAVAAAEAEGIMVIDCRSREETGFVFPCFSDPDDPENVTKCTPGFPSAIDTGDVSGLDILCAPCSRRTTAQEYVEGQYIYTYWGEGGLSWSLPYVAGVLALGWQLNPDLDAQTMKELLFQSAWVNENGFHIIDPPAFIELVQAMIE